ncbi:efflux RND transporter periplasmic adaptor subunit [Immundisolibacter sp.]
MRQFRALFRLSLLAVTAMTLPACGPSAPPPAQRPPADVGVIQIQPRRFELWTELPGRTSAYRVAEVRPQVSGILQKRLFEEGATVRSGQVLYQIDPAPYEAAVQRAAATLARARAGGEVARLKARRFAELAAARMVPQQDNDDVQAALRQAEADVQAAEASLASARIDLGYTRIRSPIDGVISESFLTEGALVTTAQPQPLARVTQLDPIYVDIQRPTADLLRLQEELAAGHLERVGPDAVRVGLLLEDGSTYANSGRLAFSGVTVDRGTGSVNLRVVFPNPEQRLLPGLYVRGRLSEGALPDALLVPQRAVTRDGQGNASVMVVGADNKLEPRRIQTRRAIGTDWLVEHGLAPGDRVVVSGPLQMMPGMPVNPVPADAPSNNAPAAGPQPAKEAAGHG